jgi:hypothetical protein
VVLCKIYKGGNHMGKEKAVKKEDKKKPKEEKVKKEKKKY